jgi:hypothetical protein
MMTKNHAMIAYVTFVAVLIYAMLHLAWPLSLAQADEGGPQLPPRNPPPTTPVIGDNKGNNDHNPPPGAYIELQIQSAPTEAWTVVQWQDTNEGWHEVEGWQGALEADGSKRWWVAVKDFGKGPFRWVVLARQGGQPLATSVLFNLPDEAYEVVQVEVVLDQ